MLRKILGLIVGYIVMAITLFAMFSGLYRLLGTDGSFLPGNYNVSTTWIVSGFVVFFVAAGIAGMVYSAISNSGSAVAMGAVIFIVGILIAISQAAQDPGTTAREVVDVDLVDAMNLARQPLWVMIANPLLGFAGALIGGQMRK